MLSPAPLRFIRLAAEEQQLADARVRRQRTAAGGRGPSACIVQNMRICLSCVGRGRYTNKVKSEMAHRSRRAGPDREGSKSGMSQSAKAPRRRLDPVAIFPFLAWPQRMSGAQMRADLLAGLTGALVVLPQGVAFATIAGMPPQYGLYASIAPTIIAALFGSSWHLVAGPSTTASLVLFASLSAFEPAGTPRYVELALTLAAMAGTMELALGFFRLGALVNFISHTVVVGYTAGVGILIMTTQLRNFFGLRVPPTSVFWEALTSSVTALPAASFQVTAVAIATLAVGVVARALKSKIPYMIPAILAGGLAGVVVNRIVPGSVSTVGALPASLPPLSAPSFDPATWALLLPTALAIAVSALNEVVSIGRALAIRSEQRLDINQEFIGQGLANLIGSFFSG